MRPTTTDDGRARNADRRSDDAAAWTPKRPEEWAAEAPASISVEALTSLFVQRQEAQYALAEAEDAAAAARVRLLAVEAEILSRHPAMHREVASLGLSARARNGLKNYGLTTVGAVIHRQRDLFRIKNLGRTSRAEIAAAITALGLWLNP